MPKKLHSINSKSLDARERKEKDKIEKREKKAKEAEDKLWEDNDKYVLKKQQRREEDEKKKAEAQRRKAESKALLDQEMSAISSQSQRKQPLAKINRQQILEEIEKKQRVIDAINEANKPSGTRIVVQPEIIEENINRSLADSEVATNIDQALNVLSVSEGDDDKHPEKRMRAAYKTFESKNLPRIKAENPSLRLSQWKQLLMKEWNKSPENPFNQGR